LPYFSFNGRQGRTETGKIVKTGPFAASLANHERNFLKSPGDLTIFQSGGIIILSIPLLRFPKPSFL